MREQFEWYRDEFLRLAKEASTPKERGRFLKYASEMVKVAAQHGLDRDDAMAQYAEYLTHTIEQRNGRKASEDMD